MPLLLSSASTFLCRFWTFLCRVWTPLQNVCCQLAGRGQPVHAGLQGEEGFEWKTEVLLPGILDEITLHHIIPKLSWRDFYILSTVSPAWRHAIRSGQVHKVRARFRSAETLVPIIYTHCAIALYSTTGNSWHQLPPIPNVLSRRFQLLPWSTPIQTVSGRRFQFPPWSGCISMDGKIYVLGDDVNSSTHCQLYVFDLARLGKWEQLASMAEPRRDFACGVKDGRIYVFGGEAIEMNENSPIPVYGAEVYDPEENSWSPIKPMTIPRFGHYVETVGEELFLLKGSGSRRYLDDDYPHGPLLLVEAYHPVEEKWRVVESFWRQEDCLEVFTARGKLYSTREWKWNRPLDIHVYDVQENSWTAFHSFSLAAILPVDSDRVVQAMENRLYSSRRNDYIPSLVGIQAVEDELLAMVKWKRVQGVIVLCLLQSRGFGSRNTEISWKLKALSTTEEVDLGKLEKRLSYFWDNAEQPRVIR